MSTGPDAATANTVLRPVARRNVQKVSHLLAADLRRRILAGDLAADQRLPSEADLTARLEVSRETLREALRILESQQLIEVKRGRGGGAVVRRPGLAAVGRYVGLLLQLRRATLANLEEARSVIEPSAAAQLACHAGADDLKTLVALHDAERAAAHDPLGFVTAMSAFDQAVIDMSGNPAIGVLAGVFRDLYAGQVYSVVGSTDTASAARLARRVIVSHSAFLDALGRNDGPLAHVTWSDYLDTTGRMLVSRSLSRQPIDVAPLWRAQAGRAEPDPAPRRASAVAAEIRARIAEGRLGEGDRLPPLAELADEFGISRPTLREALRILEMEFLLDLRTGDRAGARIRMPSTRVAAQLSGIVLEARKTVVADCFRAMRLLEPPIAGLIASRISGSQVDRLRDVNARLVASIDDIPRYIATWREAEELVFAAVDNPVLTVVAEFLHWIRVDLEPAVTADVKDQQGHDEGIRRVQILFEEFVAAAYQHDSARASRIWAENVEIFTAWIEDTELGKRPLLDLVD